MAIVRRDIASPIVGVYSDLHHTMKRRIRPIQHPRHQPMLDRVDMDVIEVTRKIVLVANGMFPITPLPDPGLRFGGAAT
jgi:hypothetical protein